MLLLIRRTEINAANYTEILDKKILDFQELLSTCTKFIFYPLNWNRCRRVGARLLCWDADQKQGAKQLIQKSYF